MAPTPLGKGLGGGVDGGDNVDEGIFYVVLMVVSRLFCGCFHCSLGQFLVAIFGVVWGCFGGYFWCSLSAFLVLFG